MRANKNTGLAVLLWLAVVAVCVFVLWLGSSSGQSTASEAPTGFDTLTNGFVDQATHDADRDKFEERDTVQKGLGPVYNAEDCVQCHATPVTGGSSQLAELRAGHNDAQGNFVPATVVINISGPVGVLPAGAAPQVSTSSESNIPVRITVTGKAITIANRSLINQRAICPGTVTDTDTHQVIFNHPNEEVEERIPDSEPIRGRRIAPSLMGLGFVEALADDTIRDLANAQPFEMRGHPTLVPVAEANGALRVGRFGWKCQHASLLSFSSDAYLNEVGITNHLSPTEIVTLCEDQHGQPCTANPKEFCGEDPEDDTSGFAQFVRATKAPPRNAALAATPEAQAGERLFRSLGCNICHTESLTTAPAGTVINGGKFTIPAALGNKIIHPFSDFLLHDVGTGDGIIQSMVPGRNALDQSTRNRFRTAPLWGLRMRNELMHDGLSRTVNDAILRHRKEAAGVTNKFRKLSKTEKRRLITFLNSL